MMDSTSRHWARRPMIRSLDQSRGQERPIASEEGERADESCLPLAYSGKRETANGNGSGIRAALKSRDNKKYAQSRGDLEKIS